MPSLLTRNRVTLALRVFILAQSIVSAFLSYFAIERYFRASKYVGWHSLSSGKVNIPIYCAFIASAIVRAIVSFSSRIILARVALYVWALDLAGRIAITGYNISTAQSDIYTLAYVLSSRQIWIDLGAYILAGVGLKMILDEARGSNLRALQRRVETVQGLDKDEKEGAVSTGQVQGTSGRAEEKEDEDEPQTLRNFVSKRWVAFGFFFLTEMSENKRRIILAGHCQWFITAAIAFNIGVEVFGLLVITRKSKRLSLALYYALIFGVLLDAALAVAGHTRFLNEPDRQLFTDILSNFIQLPTTLPWIYPTIDATVIALAPIITMRGVIKDFERIHNEKLKTEEIEHQQQHEEGESSREEKTSS